MPIVEFYEEAAAELDAARSWYEHRRPLLRDTFASRVEDAVGAIAENPLVWPANEDGARRYLLTGFPYTIVYFVLSLETIVVLAVAHQSRLPGYWRHRLSSGTHAPEPF